MYEYIRAVGVYVEGPKGEHLLDISKYSLKTVMKNFREMTIVLKDKLSREKEVSLDLYDYYGEVVNYEKNIQDWLDENATRVLRTSNKVPGNDYAYVSSQDIQYRWFQLLPGNVTIASDRQDALTVTNAPDIRVRKLEGEDLDYKRMTERSLWTVNGYLCRAIPDERELYLVGAGKDFNVNDGMHVNCLNFNTVSKLATYPINMEKFFFTDNSGAQQVRFNTTQSLSGKTVWLSIAGQLYTDGIVDVMSDNLIRVQIDKVDWFSKVFDALDFIDLEGIIDKDREVVEKDYFRTEKFFKSLFAHKNTFMIILDNEHLSVTTVPLETYSYPFTYHTEETRRHPLMLSNGMIPTYFSRKVINRRLLDIDTGVQRVYLNKTTGVHNEADILHNYQNRAKPSEYFRGYHLIIKSIIQKD